MTLDTTEKKASYGIGLQIGQQLKGSDLFTLDLDALKQGITDVLTDQQPSISINEVHSALQSMHEKSLKEKESQYKIIEEEGKNFLANNMKNENVNITESGLQYTVLTSGTGNIPKSTDTVKVHYTGSLINGKVFDSSVERGEPAQFPVNAVIKGWVEALQLMPCGSKWRLYIPHQLAYGAQGAGQDIPPFSTLIFDVELIEIM